jgi:ribosomal protein L40E
MKIVAVIFCIVSIVIAVIVGWSFLGNESQGLDKLEAGQDIWVKCANPKCGTEYQMELKEYLKEAQGEYENSMFTRPALCKECGKRSLLRAEKCQECGKIFIRGSVENDLPDRCPHCGYSEMEDRRKGLR